MPPLDLQKMSYSCCPGIKPCVEIKCLSNQLRAGLAGRQLWSELLTLARKPKFCKGKYPAKGPLHRQKMRLWQALCVLSNFDAQERRQRDVELVWSALQVPSTTKYMLSNPQELQQGLSLRTCQMAIVLCLVMQAQAPGC